MSGYSYTVQMDIESVTKKLKELEKRSDELLTWMKKNLDRANFDDVRREYTAVNLKIETLEKRLSFLKGDRVQPPPTESVNIHKTTYNSFV